MTSPQRESEILNKTESIKISIKDGALIIERNGKDVSQNENIDTPCETKTKEPELQKTESEKRGSFSVTIEEDRENEFPSRLLTIEKDQDLPPAIPGSEKEVPPENKIKQDCKASLFTDGESLIKDLFLELLKNKFNEDQKSPENKKDSRPENDPIWEKFETRPDKREDFCDELPEDDDDVSTLMLQKYDTAVSNLLELNILCDRVLRKYSPDKYNVITGEIMEMSRDIGEMSVKLIRRDGILSSFSRLKKIRERFGSITAYNKLSELERNKWITEGRKESLLEGSDPLKNLFLATVLLD